MYIEPKLNGKAVYMVSQFDFSQRLEEKKSNLKILHTTYNMIKPYVYNYRKSLVVFSIFFSAVI